MNKGFWDEIRQWAPECVEQLSLQSSLFHEKLIELVGRKANWVSRAEFDRQKQVCQRLEERCTRLEMLLEDFLNKSQ